MRTSGESGTRIGVDSVKSVRARLLKGRFMPLRNVLIFAWLSTVLAACATARSPERLATIKALEAESAARLAGEGELQYEADATKRNGYDYCSLAVGLIEQGQLRLGIREASKALFLGQSTGDRCLVAFAKRDLAVETGPLSP